MVRVSMEDYPVVYKEDCQTAHKEGVHTQYGTINSNVPWRSQGEAMPPGSQRSQPLSSSAPREVDLSVS